MKKINILVFPCATEIGLEIHKSLSNEKFINLLGVSSKVSNHGKYVYKNYLEISESVNDDNLINSLITISKTHKIDFVFPAHDSFIYQLAINSSWKNKFKVLGSNKKTNILCRSKSATYKHLFGKIKTPTMYSDLKDIIYPTFVKPDASQGSKGAKLMHSEIELIHAIKEDPSLILMENLSGEEYTIDCFTNKKRELLYVNSRIRNRIQNGISVSSKIVNTPKHLEIAKTLNQNIKFRGAWFFQLKNDNNGEPTLLEVAPRVSGTMALNRVNGVNLPLITLYDALDIDIQIVKNSIIREIDRSLINRYSNNIEYQNVYIDLDDTLIINQAINTDLIKFLYQCINKQKKIILISKHEANINNTLEKYRLNNLFDEIIHLGQDDIKANFIQKNSLFIDDSFSERNFSGVKDGITTISPDQIEGFLDWRI